MAEAVTSRETSKSPEELLDDLIEIAVEHHPGTDVDAIKTAYGVAAEAHSDQVRQTGDPYIVHPLAVAQILATYGLDTATIVAALLHDVIEDTEFSLEDLERDFGSEDLGRCPHF